MWLCCQPVPQKRVVTLNGKTEKRASRGSLDRTPLSARGRLLCEGWPGRYPQWEEGCKNGGSLEILKSQCFPFLYCIDGEQPSENLTLHRACLQAEDLGHGGLGTSWAWHLTLVLAAQRSGQNLDVGVIRELEDQLFHLQ